MYIVNSMNTELPNPLVIATYILALVRFICRMVNQ